MRKRAEMIEGGGRADGKEGAEEGGEERYYLVVSSRGSRGERWEDMRK